MVEFESREQRDSAMEAVMEDPEVVAMMGDDQIADMGQMRYGGFETFVDP